MNEVTAPKLCPECKRRQPPTKPPIPVDAITHCGECNIPFSLDEIWALFREANRLDSNHAQQFRCVIVDDLISALKKGNSRNKHGMNMQLDTSEVQTAVADYLRKRGVVIEDVRQVQIEIISASGERVRIVGYTPVVMVNNVKLSEGPYR